MNVLGFNDYPLHDHAKLAETRGALYDCITLKFCVCQG